MNLGKYAKTLEKLVVDNSPAIMTGVGIVGTALTAYLTHKAAVKSTVDVLEHESARRMKGEEALSRTETLKLTWVNYLPPVAAGTITILSIYGANRVSTKRMAALAAGYTMLDSRFDEYKKKMTDKLGITKEEKARAEVAQERTDENPPPQSIIIATGKSLFRDEPSGRYFESTMEDVKKAMNDTNYQIISEEYATLSDFYMKLGLSPTSLSEEFGWRLDKAQHKEIEIQFSTVITGDGRPCICLDYNVTTVRNGY